MKVKRSFSQNLKKLEYQKHLISNLVTKEDSYLAENIYN